MLGRRAGLGWAGGGVRSALDPKPCPLTPYPCASAFALPPPTCAGTFKQQHDTGQNSKYVIVYPRVTCASASSAGGGGGGGGAGAPLVNTKSPEYIACAADLESFKQKVGVKVREGGRGRGAAGTGE